LQKKSSKIEDKKLCKKALFSQVVAMKERNFEAK
jgi:hypothetical protein